MVNIQDGGADREKTQKKDADVEPLTAAGGWWPLYMGHLLKKYK